MSPSSVVKVKGKESMKSPKAFKGEDRDYNEGTAQSSRPPLVRPTTSTDQTQHQSNRNPFRSPMGFEPAAAPLHHTLPPRPVAVGSNSIPLGNRRPWKSVAASLPSANAIPNTANAHTPTTVPAGTFGSPSIGQHQHLQFVPNRPERTPRSAEEPQRQQTSRSLDKTTAENTLVAPDSSAFRPSQRYLYPDQVILRSSPVDEIGPVASPPHKKRRLDECEDGSVAESSRQGKTMMKAEVPSDEDMLVSDDDDTAMHEGSEPVTYQPKKALQRLKDEAMLSGVKAELLQAQEPEEHVPADSSSGSTFYKMRHDCIWTNPTHQHARESWRTSIIEALAAEGKMALRTMIRPDGLAVDWIAAPRPSISAAPPAVKHSEMFGREREHSHVQANPPTQILTIAPVSFQPHVKPPTVLPRRSSFLPPLLAPEETWLSPQDSSRVNMNIDPSTSNTNVPRADPATSVPTLLPEKTFNSQRGDQRAKGSFNGADRDPTEADRRHSILSLEPALPISPLDADAVQRQRKTKGSRPKKSKAEEAIRSIVAMYDDHRNTAFAFLLQFLRLFDTNRLALFAAYHPEGVFSCQTPDTALISEASVFSTEIPSRNLRSYSSLTEHEKIAMNSTTTLKSGPHSIIDCIQSWSKWIHPFSPSSAGTGNRRFAWDVTVLPGMLSSKKKKRNVEGNLLIVCHGDLVNPEDESQKVSFDRSFVLTRNTNEATLTYWPHVIISDQVTIRKWRSASPWDQTTEWNPLGL
ncbi:nuclear mRNA export, poly(A)+RNA binding protein [Tulasnella sp. 330]|nr:nuclear mRNA export, poly(A)+RNA binding protein [Tulasnella sp. 330]